MNAKLLSWPAAALLGLSSLSAQAVPSSPDLIDLFINIDGLTTYGDYYGDPHPAEVNFSGFDMNTGLGTITATITGVGSHTFDAFFDHDVGRYSFDNEVGTVTGFAAVGQSWEIDEPGFISGDIVDNFEYSTLDNMIGILGEEDVSMAMGWDFILEEEETAEITLLLSDKKTGGGLYLTHSNMVGHMSQSGIPYSNYDFYLSSKLRITSPIPEPSILLLLGIGLAGMMVNRRRVKV